MNESLTPEEFSRLLDTDPIFQKAAELYVAINDEVGRGGSGVQISLIAEALRAAEKRGAAAARRALGKEAGAEEADDERLGPTL